MVDDVQGNSELRPSYEAFVKAFQNEDTEALRALFAPTAVMINPAGNALSGRDAILNFMQRAQRIQSVRFEPSESRRLSDALVREVGDLTLTVRGEGRETREVPGKFLMLWTRLDGAWAIESCVWSRSAPGQGGRMGGGRGGMGGGGRGGMGGGGGGRMGGGGGGRMGGGGGGRMGGGGGGRMGGGDRMGVRRPGPDEGGSFNRRNLQQDEPAPLIPRVD